jgi:hypothetical protein
MGGKGQDTSMKWSRRKMTDGRWRGRACKGVGLKPHITVHVLGFKERKEIGLVERVGGVAAKSREQTSTVEGVVVKPACLNVRTVNSEGSAQGCRF